MKIQGVNKNNSCFTGLLNNKTALRGLEKISEHGASFAAGVSLAGAVLLRPAVISLTPKTDEKNKQYAGINSVSSGAAKFLGALAVTLPVENAVKKIDKNPADFLLAKTIENLKSSGKNLPESKDYKFLTQLIKLSGSFFAAIPKSVLTVALIPVLADNLFNKKDKSSLNMEKYKIENEAFKNFVKSKNPNFKGNFLAKKLGGVINNENLQNFARKHSKNNTNIARNISNATDMLLTGTSVFQIKKSKKIDEKRKNPLVYNNILSTGFCILFGNGIDKLIQKGSKKSIEKFKSININNPKLAKYIEGINILRPTLIFALIYYGILPFATTFFADKIDKQKNNV